MFDNRLSIPDLIAGVATFGLVLSLVSALALLWWRRRAARARALEQRLGISDHSRWETRTLHLWREGQEATTTVPTESRKMRFHKMLVQFARDTGWEVPVQTMFFSVVGVMGLVIAIVLVISKNVLLGLLGAGAVPMIGWVAVQWRINKHTALFERQLIDALQMAARSLRAGHPLLGAFRLISEEMKDPIRTIFADICQQQQLGVSLDSALRQASAESSSPDMKLFATSVSIQLRTGGNLADMMDRVAAVIRERIRLARRARVLIAQTQFSKRVLLVMPFLLFVILNIIQPEYMSKLYTTDDGRFLMGLAGLGLLMGMWLMNRMAKLER